MSVLSIAIKMAEEGPHRDSGGQVTTHHWFLPETYELIYGGLASVIIFGALYKFALPMMKKSLADRTARIQKELDDGRNARTTAEAEAAQIRSAKGDIEGERARLLADADTQAAQMLTEGRARLATEVADAEAKADADIAQLASRSGDELRGEIARLSAGAADRLLLQQLDAATHNDLIESFIAKVGASK